MDAYNQELTDGKKIFFKKFFWKILGENFFGEKFLDDRKKIGSENFSKKIFEKSLKIVWNVPKKIFVKNFSLGFLAGSELSENFGGKNPPGNERGSSPPIPMG